LTDNPEKSQYRKSIFVRNLEKTTPEALGAGFQEASIGAAASAATGGLYQGAVQQVLLSA